MSQSTENERYQYAYLKIKNIDAKDENHKRILVQIVDMSDKIRFDELSAEKNFQKVINETISEDCQTPLEDLKKGIQTMSESALQKIGELFHDLR